MENMIKKLHENNMVQGAPKQTFIEEFDENGNSWVVAEWEYPHLAEEKKPVEIPQEVRDYINFMYNPCNRMNCENCPENYSFAVGWGGVIGPCGQQHCWVDAHCKD